MSGIPQPSQEWIQEQYAAEAERSFTVTPGMSLYSNPTGYQRYLNTLILADRAARAARLHLQPEVIGIRGATTQQEGIAKARHYGTNLLSGNIVESWTSLEDTWGPYLHPDGVVKMEVLNMIIDFGDGPDGGIVDDLIYINNQLIENVSNIAYQERRGTMDQTVMTGFEAKKKEYRLDQELLEADDPFIFTTVHNWADDFEFTISFPDGLFGKHRDNYLIAANVHFHIDVSIKDADSWTPVFDQTITDTSEQPAFNLYSINTLVPGTIVPGNYYDIRYSRETPAVTGRGVTKSVLRSIREVANVEFTRPGRALLGLRAVGSSDLTDLNVKVVRKGRIIGYYNAAGIPTWLCNNNRAWVTFDILTQPVLSGSGLGPYTVERYDGLEPHHLDMDFFYKWSVFTSRPIDDGYGGTEHRCPCNLSVTNFTKAMQLAEALAAVGRANIYRKGDLVTGWIDDVVADVTDLVTMDTIIERSWENLWTEPDDKTDGIAVVFNNAAAGFEEDFAEYSPGDAANFQEVTRIPGIGLPSRGTAIHFARFLMESQRLILNVNKFKVAKAGFRYKPGQVIRLQCRPANWGEAFRVLSSTADTITVDRDASTLISAGNVIYIRSFDTVAEVVVTDMYIVDSVAGAVITATVNWDITPLVDNVVAVGVMGDIKLRRIIRIASTQDNYFKVEVQTYDADLYDSDLYVPLHPDDAYNYPGILRHTIYPVTSRDISKAAMAVSVPMPDFGEPNTSNIDWSIA